MKRIKFEYNQTDELNELIKDVYFGDNNLGKLLNTDNKHLKLDTDDIYYKVLSGLDYKVKIKNDIIDGTMEFNVEEHESHINLIPSSSYCIVKEKKYSFY